MDKHKTLQKYKRRAWYDLTVKVYRKYGEISGIIRRGSDEVTMKSR